MIIFAKRWPMNLLGVPPAARTYAAIAIKPE